MRNMYGGYGGFGGLGYSLDNGATIAIFKMLALFSAVLGLVICFFGYKVQKFFVSLYTGVLFGSFGFALFSRITDGNTGISILIAILFAVVGFLIGFKFFKAMLVFLTGLSGFALGFVIVGGTSRFNMDFNTMISGTIVGLILGGLFGFVMAKIFKPLIIIVTSIQGGFSFGYSICAMFAFKGIYDWVANWGAQIFGTGKDVSAYILLGIVFAIAGCFFQFKTAERKVSDFINELKNGSINTENNFAQNENVLQAKNKFMQLLSTPIILPRITNIQLFFISGAVLAFISLFRLNSFLTFVEILAFVAVLVILFMMYKNKFIPYIYTNSALGVVVIMGAINVMFSLIKSGSIYGLLLHGGMGLFAYALWVVLTKSDVKTILFVISGGLVLLNFVLLAIKGSFSFLPLSIVCVNLPFAIPFIKKYIPYEANNEYSNQAMQSTSYNGQNSQNGEQNIVYCSNCGQQLDSQSKFCNSCGNPIHQVVK